MGGRTDLVMRVAAPDLRDQGTLLTSSPWKLPGRVTGVSPHRSPSQAGSGYLYNHLKQVVKGLPVMQAVIGYIGRGDRSNMVCRTAVGALFVFKEAQ